MKFEYEMNNLFILAILRSNWIVSNYLVLRHKPNVDASLNTSNFNFYLFKLYGK